MKDELVSFETAKLAKEKGFKFEFKDDYNYDLGFHSYFKRRSNGEIVDISHWYADTNQNIQQYTSLDIAAPTQSLLQRWLREVHEWHIVVIQQSDKNWMYYIQDSSIQEFDYKSFEEALEAGLQYSLKLKI